MSDIISIPFGRVISGTVIGPLKTSKLYIQSRMVTKKYEKEKGVVPLKKMNKKTYKTDNKEIDLEKRVKNPLVALIKKNNSSATDVYYDENGVAFLSCSYQLNMNLINKKPTIIVNLIHSNAKANKSYYYLICEQIHNLITDQTEGFIKELQ